MKTNQIFLMATGLALLAAGCATQQNYSQVSNQFPPIPAGEGRIIVFRGNEFNGIGQRDTIKVNGDKVSNLLPNSFFYMDRPAGNYAVSGSPAGFLREIKGEPLNVSLNPGETKYIRIRLEAGIVAGPSSITYTSLENPDAAMQVLPNCIYAGEK